MLILFVQGRLVTYIGGRF